MAIKCCLPCKPPKRHTACWDHCPEYLAEKEQEEQKKAKDNLKRKVGNDIYNQRRDRIEKVLRRHGRK